VERRAVVEGDVPADTNAGPEVDGPPLRLDEGRVEPVGDGLGVVDRRRERDDLEVRDPPPKGRHGHLQRGPPPLGPEEMDLVDDDAGEVVDPLRAVPDRGVDLLARGHDHVVAGQLLAGRVEVAGGDADVDAG
jgi:hypothetical protein